MCKKSKRHPLCRSDSIEFETILIECLFLLHIRQTCLTRYSVGVNKIANLTRIKGKILILKSTDGIKCMCCYIVNNSGESYAIRTCNKTNNAIQLVLHSCDGFSVKVGCSNRAWVSITGAGKYKTNTGITARAATYTVWLLSNVIRT